MGRQLKPDPKMLESLDLLMDYEVLEQEKDWQALGAWDEKESADDVKEQSDAEKQADDGENKK